jgi:hypothetical protein
MGLPLPIVLHPSIWPIFQGQLLVNGFLLPTSLAPNVQPERVSAWPGWAGVECRKQVDVVGQLCLKFPAPVKD